MYCSSAEVYGASFKSGQALDETALLDPVKPYKAAADIPFNHTGPGQTPHFAIPAFASQIARIERGDQELVIRVGELWSKRDSSTSATWSTPMSKRCCDSTICRTAG